MESRGVSDDVRIATSLRSHRKTKRLKRLLGKEGCWSLICLFLWAGAERWTGDLSGLTDADIEEEADWDGDPGALIAALVEVKFIAGPKLSRRIHEWAEHNPYAATKGDRIEKGKAAANARWNRKADAPSMPTASGGNATTPIEQCPPAPAPTPTSQSESNGDTGLPAAVGVFEGHDSPRGTPNPVAAFAVALNHAGFNVTSLNPDLVAYVQDGGTVEHLTECAKHPDCAGKKATYPIRMARRELAEPAAQVATGPPRIERIGKTATAVHILQGIKNGLADSGNFDGISEAALPRLGSSTGG
jgi:hypothetical protein